MSNKRDQPPPPRPIQDLPPPKSDEQHIAADPSPVQPVTRREPIDADPDSERVPSIYNRRPTVEQLEGLASELQPKEKEILLGILNKQLGRAAKTPTGRYVVKLGIKLPKRADDTKPRRLKPGTVIAKDEFDDQEQLEHFERQGAIEPEYA